MVRSIDIHASGVVDVTVSLTTAGCPIRSHFQTAVDQAVAGARRRDRRATSTSTSSTTRRRARCSASSAAGGLPDGALAQVRTSICIGSGKGGVGKSTLTANLAAALAADGKRVGVLDADVWGYSIPRMFGLGSDARAVNAERKIIPLDAHGVKVMSIGFFVEEDERRRVARPDAPQGADAVPRGRRLGRARLPPRRPAARHRRRLDDARPAAAAGASS